jgi:proline iminopeptidase
MLSGESSFIGFKYQQTFHRPNLPAQTVHREAKSMGHNMLTLNPAWRVSVITEFFSTRTQDGAFEVLNLNRH